MSHAQVGMGVGEEENCEETPAGGGKQGQKGVQRPGKALDSTQLGGGHLRVCSVAILGVLGMPGSQPPDT